MSVASVRRLIRDRLREADRPDRSWFLITRVHLSAARISDTAEYLHTVAGDADWELREMDYRAIARIVDVADPDPGVTIRRHLFLAMETPLDLIRRTDGRFWKSIHLTEAGIDLATTNNPSEVLDRALSNLVFCRQPFYSAQREAEYEDFNVRPYIATQEVLQGTDGRISRAEYDFFVSRIRTPDEVQWATNGIQDFRNLDEAERDALTNEVYTEIRQGSPTPKAYLNWRDMALHTFSLFSLGISTIRRGDELQLTNRLISSDAEDKRTVLRATSRLGSTSVLQIPNVSDESELSSPPPPVAARSGSDAELLVGQLLESAGWTVIYYSHRRGFGFDIWARLGASVMLVEVKSSGGQLGSVGLTRLEFEAARHHGPNFVLALVEDMDSSAPKVRFIQDPVEHLPIDEVQSVSYRITSAAIRNLEADI